MRILLSEGSGLTSRQVATRLVQLGHEVELLSSTPICLARFTRHVRRVHRVPRFGVDPFAWLEVAETIALARHIDLLFPTQEQIAVLSARAGMLRVKTVVPPFAALRLVQDKISAFRTLSNLGIPQPISLVAKSLSDLGEVESFPVYVKRPIGTASDGVRRALSPAALEVQAKALGLGERDLLIQQESKGPLVMVQAVADSGRLIAFHANLRLREGAGGGAALKEGVAVPELDRHLERLVAALGWHGAISLDIILDETGLQVIDVNPRLVEPMNAWFSGVDLVEAMLALGRGEHPPVQSAGKVGVRSRQALLVAAGAAQHGGTRRAVLRELWRALIRRGEYAEAREELTPVAGDILAGLPVAAVALAVLVRPALWRSFHAGAVGPYALTPEAWGKIVASCR